MAVGYATLYGDMAGGFAPIKDCSKLLVYRLAAWRNAQGDAPPAGRVIPQRVIDRPPSAELRPDQKDSDSLPPYEVLDPILEAFIEDDLSVEEIVARGFERATVSRVLDLVQRIQAAAGAARRAGEPPRLRPRLALSDHERLSALSAPRDQSQGTYQRLRTGTTLPGSPP
jgi:NAD+ synthetase